MSDSPDDPHIQLKQYIDAQALMLEITQRIAAGGSLSAILPDVASATLRVSQADGVRIVLENTPAPVIYASGPYAAKMSKFEAPVARLVSERGMVSAADLSAPGEISAAINGTGDKLGAFLAVPLNAQRALRGLLWIATEQPRQFSAEEQTLLSIIAAQVAVAIANAFAFDAARRGREQLAAILASSADPVLVVDNHAVVLLFNPAAEQALGVQASTAMGKLIAEVTSADPLVQLLSGDGDSADAVEWQNDEGQTFAPRVSDVCDESGKRTGRVLVLRDITRYKTLRENQAEFVSTVSHDLRSPLTYMQGFATMMPMVGPLNERQQGFADKIIGGIAQMTDLVEKILDAGRLDPEGNYQLNREAIDVIQIVADVVNSHMQPAEKKNLALLSKVDPGLPILNLDKLMLQRALNNLVDNAIKYTPEKGTITVTAAIHDHELRLSVQDTGLGISAENQKHLFERFHRVRRKEHQTVKGSGLGLFIVKNIAQRHGGDASVESVEGQGSNFSIKIPLEGANLVGGDSKR